MGKGDFAKIPNGLPSVEDRFTLIFQGVRENKITLTHFVDLVASAPARMFGLYPHKGTIAPGFDADIVVFDPDVERTLSAETHHMNVDYSCYEGMTVWGLPEVVMQRGRILVENGEWHGKEGQGRFIARSRFQAP
jgi:dihydropyrimidinase